MNVPQQPPGPPFPYGTPPPPPGPGGQWGYGPPPMHPRPPGPPWRPVPNWPRITYGVVLCVVGILFLADGTISIIDSIGTARIAPGGETQHGLTTALAIARGAVIVPGGVLALVAAILHFARKPAARVLAVAPAATGALAYLVSAGYEMHYAATTLPRGFRFDVGYFFDNRFTALLVIGVLATVPAFIPAISRSTAARPAPPMPWPHR